MVDFHCHQAPLWVFPSARLCLSLQLRVPGAGLGSGNLRTGFLKPEIRVYSLQMSSLQMDKCILLLCQKMTVSVSACKCFQVDEEDRLLEPGSLQVWGNLNQPQERHAATWKDHHLARKTNPHHWKKMGHIPSLTAVERKTRTLMGPVMNSDCFLAENSVRKVGNKERKLVHLLESV